MGLQLVNNGAQVDAWVVGLFLVAATPWLSMLVQSVKVPGIDVQFREVKEEQKRQGDDIKALQFLVANFVVPHDYQVLQNFADEKGVVQVDDTNAPRLFTTVNRLKELRFLAPTALWAEAASKVTATEWKGDMKALFTVSELGREYLRLRDVGLVLRRLGRQLSDVIRAAAEHVSERLVVRPVDRDVLCAGLLVFGETLHQPPFGALVDVGGNQRQDRGGDATEGVDAYVL